MWTTTLPFLARRSTALPATASRMSPRCSWNSSSVSSSRRASSTKVLAFSSSSGGGALLAVAARAPSPRPWRITGRGGNRRRSWSRNFSKFCRESDKATSPSLPETLIVAGLGRRLTRDPSPQKSPFTMVARSSPSMKTEAWPEATRKKLSVISPSRTMLVPRRKCRRWSSVATNGITAFGSCILKSGTVLRNCTQSSTSFRFCSEFACAL
mmetsp:Transcript_8726/g.27048  ORF Transcript_8726/g.27048 Transcript_8726/m.27048 type:complete len:211 (-) Transcript_8726:37-669(-)